jgi:hypothetical protein
MNGEAQIVTMVVQSGFTGLAAFLVWKLVGASDSDRKASQEREQRMAERIDVLHANLMEIASESVKAQSELSTALRELRETMNYCINNCKDIRENEDV